MYYPCSENKDADQLRGYREADLCLCFRPCKLLVFSRTGSNIKFFQVKFSTFTYEKNLCILHEHVFIMEMPSSSHLARLSSLAHRLFMAGHPPGTEMYLASCHPHLSNIIKTNTNFYVIEQGYLLISPSP